MKLNKTQQKILETQVIVNYESPRMLKAAKQLESMGLIKLIEDSNRYGFKWLKIERMKNEN
jgi:hypothetical protein